LYKTTKHEIICLNVVRLRS